MIFRSLASSSHGNAYLVSDGETTLLLECGVSYPKLTKLMREKGFSPAQITACLITHEHKDHSLSAETLLRHGIPIYASEGTARALNLSDIEIIETGDTLSFGGFCVRSFPVWHDAAQPVGYLIDDTATGERLFFATDTSSLHYLVESPTYLAIECNYEEAALADSRLPESLQNRIRHTHLSFPKVVQWLQKQDLSHVQAVWLLHLSSKNSCAEGWRKQLRQRFPQIQIFICNA